MAKATIKEAARMLVEEETSGEDVIGYLRRTCRKLSSLSAMMSNVRAEVLTGRHAGYDDAGLRAFSHEEGVVAFLNSEPRDQYKIQRDHLQNPRWTPQAEDALRRLKIAPESMADFHLCRADQIDLKRQQEEAQKKKNLSDILHVTEGGKLFEWLSGFLGTEDGAGEENALVCALLLCSGRRFAEIMNGRSTFRQVEGSRYHCLFEGQVKKRGDGKAYTIPLLCQYTEFERGLSALRARQPADITNLTNKEVSNKYQVKMRTYLTEKGLVYRSCQSARYTICEQHTQALCFTSFLVQARLLGLA